jgi:hypothetical protein
MEENKEATCAVTTPYFKRLTHKCINLNIIIIHILICNVKIITEREREREREREGEQGT